MMDSKDKLPPKDNMVEDKSTVQKKADSRSQDEQLARIIAKLSEEDPAMIAEVIKKWLEESKNK